MADAITYDAPKQLFGQPVKQVKEIVRSVVGDYAKRIRDRMADSMREPKSGIHHPGLPNRSSAIGEAPAVQSGDLINSLKIRHNRSGIGWSAEIGSFGEVEYAAYLDPDMARYFAYPALARHADDFVRELQRALNNM
jgi:hypothetical protein